MYPSERILAPRTRKKPAPLVRWNSELRDLRALSIRQPWAWLVVNGYKDVENRTWSTNYRGPILVHAGLSRSDLHPDILDEIEEDTGVKLPREFELGGIVGTVEIVDCGRKRLSPWHQRGFVGWTVSRSRQLPFRACKGALGLFAPDL